MKTDEIIIIVFASAVLSIASLIPALDNVPLEYRWFAVKCLLPLYMVGYSSISVICCRYLNGKW